MKMGSYAQVFAKLNSAEVDKAFIFQAVCVAIWLIKSLDICSGTVAQGERHLGR
jgi:hypothetical protein